MNLFQTIIFGALSGFFHLTPSHGLAIYQSFNTFGAILMPAPHCSP